MGDVATEPGLLKELRERIDRGLTSGELMGRPEFERQTTLFGARFGPAALRDFEGETLLQLMHGRQDSGSRCLAYWLEFKNDPEFSGQTFGGIRGGSALKFGIFQREKDDAWIGGSAKDQTVLSTAEAAAIARTHRDELIAGGFQPRIKEHVVAVGRGPIAKGHARVQCGHQSPHDDGQESQERGGDREAVN